MPTRGISDECSQNITDLFSMPSAQDNSANKGKSIVAQKYEEEEFTDDYVPTVSWINEDYMKNQREAKAAATQSSYESKTAMQPKPADLFQQISQIQQVNKPTPSNNAYMDKIRENAAKNNLDNAVKQNIYQNYDKMSNFQSKVGKYMSYNQSPVKHNLEQSQERSNLVVHNAMEDLVVMKINSMVEKFNCCMCEKCINDMAAIVLNHVPSKYIVAPREQIEVLTANFVRNPDIDIENEVIKAIMTVKTYPRH